ncbi:MAG TPA: helix-turn-helix domain-containing protein [Nitrososphaeraceae archaeon]|jgi:predicted transcriptional regulator
MPSNPPLSTLTRMNSTIRDLFIYLYDLSPLDLDLLFYLVKHKKPMTLEELSTIADRDKSTTFRSLQKLVSLGICTKETKTIKEGGYYHVYSAIDIKTFKLETEKKVKELEASFHRILRKFEDNMQEIISSVYNESPENTSK